MRFDPDMTSVFCVLAGALAVAAGAMTAFALPQGLCLTLGLLLVIRICWLDDNVVNDLADREKLPASYAAAFARRQRLAVLLFGTPPSADVPSPGMLATRLVAEARFWSAFVLAGAAVLVAQAMPFGFLLSFAIGIWLFLWALRRADQLTASLRCLEAGLPQARGSRRTNQRPGVRR